MPSKTLDKSDTEDTNHHQTQRTKQSPPPPLRHRRSVFLKPFRSRSSSEQPRQQASTPTPAIPATVREAREGPALKSSTSAIFIAKMKSELFLSQFKRAQEAYLSNDLALCRHRCTELLERPALHLDTRIETLQLLATIVSLPVAREHLSDALCLLDLAVERGGIAPGQVQALLGMKITTLDLLGRLEKEFVKIGREEEAEAEGWKMRGSLRGAITKRRNGAREIMIHQPLVEFVDQSMPLHPA
ncbi:hypothetical protein ONS95_005666 [Cadophora gregata]|uniref:uncharacterized protein n=1 Tax=Cadophora gregata TaxID=51156 RepID=UPI0026DC6EFA|nr:uncharacterized protein ONS95_005666 [Cadophora gregata]KAK0103653.1 hypothetical protein ONS95_005666 [Cadophora gregata]KAK0107848.1 hypothetical protein ONS96_003638 [Cadophora gregata f. sp. sojae]